MGMRSLPFFKGKKGYQFAGGGITSDGGGGSVPIATTSTLGGVIVGNGLSVSPEGVLTSNAGIDYSTVEKNTGSKWIDGKDIYVKVFPTSELSPQGSTEIQCNTSSLNIDSLVFAYCYSVSASGWVQSNDNFIKPSANINFEFSQSISAQGTHYAVIFYTKTS